MIRFVITLVFLIATFPLLSQEVQRVVIDGKIIVPEGDNLEGMTVYNETSQRGTITNTDGEFRISVAINDSISFSALQFQKFTVVVDQGVIDSGELNVFISETVTELPEVVVLPHDLSGNVNVDVARIQVADPDLPRYSAADLENMNVVTEPDALTGPGKNEAMAASKTRLIHGLNLVNIFKVLVGDSNGSHQIKQREKDEYIRQLYNDEFFQENLDIKKENINDFIFYASDNGLTAEMMQEGNELDLIEFLIAKGREYKNQVEN
ncbi:MAG: carboxypeptidase-like regulatory domain-containing protein [Salegentibacter sp.]|uniref:CarboxypepD_reg-like domain-containing protein n=1 Tax=Salegentibacter flavus TaxID=287099 RepID=A0A1I4XUH3_9FLAO|nr:MULTISPECIES: carboxypeptidase-like regulatory domain-containing protein [Salegentibacter]MDR9456499.1 carboxypeptidase-like regulatory domain-containing protein [Salegentibacter sp.]SFN29407.1 CarboxypepD_reg-like domain-containing protein [Salegentibacter flavus]